MKAQIRELIEFKAPPRVRREESGAIVLEGVKLLGNRSANVNPDGTQNVYTLEARRAANNLYEGAKVFLNHPERSNPGRERGYEEQIGRVRNPEARADGTWGDVVLNPKHPLAEQVEWDATNQPDSLGLSHNAQGRGRVDGRDCLIEEITRVRSVDLVCAAATTKGLFESRNDKEATVAKLKPLIEAIKASDESKLLEMVDESALVGVLADDSLAAEEKVMKALALIAAGKVEPSEDEAEPEADVPESAAGASDPGDSELVESLRRKVDELELAQTLRERRDRREKLLAESRIPAEALTKVFLEQIHGADDDSAAKALIEDRKRLVFHQNPSSGGARHGELVESKQINSVDDLLGAL